MSHVIDLAGQVFGRLTVLCRSGHRGPHLLWSCRCACGNMHAVTSQILRLGESQSCGCLARELVRQRTTTHGRSGTRAYRTWRSIKNRCYNSRQRGFSSYGGRGISMCDAWKNSFEQFHRDMGDPPDGHTLDRIDNDGHYSPENCRWATLIQQANNKRSNRLIVVHGDTTTMAAAARAYGIAPDALKTRLNSGWDHTRAVTKPTRPVTITFSGQTKTVQQWANALGIPRRTLSRRLELKWPPRLILTPVHRRTR